MNNKKLFLRVNTVVLSAFCLLVTGCKNNEPAPNEKEQSVPPSNSVIPEETYNIVRPDFTPDYENYGVSASPSGVNMTYYSDIYSRGFSWLTDADTEDTELYLVKSDKGEQADFSGATLISGKSTLLSYDTSGNITAEGLDPAKGSGNASATTLMSHKVHVENLEKGKAYSYKIGSEAGYTYGAFIVEKDQAKTITAMHLSDAQTRDLNQTNVWRNTFVEGVKTAGKDLDMVLYNGDQFDQNNRTNSSSKDNTPFRLFRYSKAIDVIQDYKFDLPYMSSSGNHEPSSPYSHYIMGEIDYAGYDYKGCYYSYDYDYAHFVVLNTNTINDEQINWLKDDLDDAHLAKWKIVMLHISPYSTGDHSNDSENQKIVEKLTPIFSEKHVDLVLQAHDHTYNKTLPYKWDAAGYTTTYDNAEAVNLEPETQVVGDREYDRNPEGTYYVTTGAAGHRCGAPEASDGIWAEVVKDGDNWKALNSSKTFLNNKYKIELGSLKYDTQLEPYTTGSYTSTQNYAKGNLATGCVNAQMFGVLNMSETTLSYDVYTVKVDKEVEIFDSIDILKDQSFSNLF